MAFDRLKRFMPGYSDGGEVLPEDFEMPKSMLQQSISLGSKDFQTTPKRAGQAAVSGLIGVPGILSGAEEASSRLPVMQQLARIGITPKSTEEITEPYLGKYLSEVTGFKPQNITEGAIELASPVVAGGLSKVLSSEEALAKLAENRGSASLRKKLGLPEDLSNSSLQDIRNRIYPQSKSINAPATKMVGEEVAEKLGSDKLQDYINYLRKEKNVDIPITEGVLPEDVYGLHNSNATYKNKLAQLAGYPDTQKSNYIIINPDKDNLSKLGTLRHEIQHHYDVLNNPKFQSMPYSTYRDSRLVETALSRSDIPNLDFSKPNAGLTPEQVNDIVPSLVKDRDVLAKRVPGDATEHFKDLVSSSHHSVPSDFEGDWILHRLIKEQLGQGNNNFQQTVINRMKLLANRDPKLQQYLNQMSPQELMKKVAGIAAITTMGSQLSSSQPE
jgi:hypothetical protein